MTPSFLILDDHAIVRSGLISYLKTHFSGSCFYETSSLSEAKAELSEQQIDFALLDYKVGEEHSLSLIPDITHYHPNVKILVFSMLDGREVGAACIQAGAHGFLSKSAPPSEILEAIQTIQEGRLFASLAISRALLAPATEHPSDNITKALSKRELEVFSLLGEGLKVSDIAGKLGISVKTVEAHRDHIKNKLGLQNSSQVIIQAAEWLKSQY